jgi:hypothetical protein
MINYDILGKSVGFYEAKGFQRVEAPWTVTKQVSDITRPPDKREFQLLHEDNKVLVASGEQSFLYQYLKGHLPLGMFQTITPCFRRESFDALHTKYFLKNELIKTDCTTPKDLEQVMAAAKAFFELYLNPVEIVPTGDNQYDLFYGGTELGSYGIRRCDFLTWIYGTGVAEPRLSGLLYKHGLSPTPH